LPVNWAEFEKKETMKKGAELVVTCIALGERVVRKRKQGDKFLPSSTTGTHGVIEKGGLKQTEWARSRSVEDRGKKSKRLSPMDDEEGERGSNDQENKGQRGEFE